MLNLKFPKKQSFRIKFRCPLMLLTYFFQRHLLNQNRNIKIMKIEKENSDPNYSSFSNLLKKIDVSRLDEFEIRTLKQEHGYLEKLRQQRLKIEEIKRKYEDCENSLRAQEQQNQRLVQIINQKSNIIEDLEEKLDDQICRMETLEKTLSRQNEQDKNKNKNRLRQLEQENEELKKALKHKQLIQMTLEEEWGQKVKNMKQTYSLERRSILNDCEQRLREMKTKCVQGEIPELKSLITRQNKALKLQNEKYEEVCSRNDSLTEEVEWLASQLEQKNAEIEQNRERVDQLVQELRNMESRFEEQTQNNKVKNQLDEIRRKMNEMTKGEIQRIEFIVNEE